MYIEDGVVVLKTDSAHVEVSDIRLLATYGFERSAQLFNLFSRA